MITRAILHAMALVLAGTLIGCDGTPPSGPVSLPANRSIAPAAVEDAFVYATNSLSNTVSVFHASDGAPAATVPVGTNPRGVDVTPSGDLVYVANQLSNSVSVIRASDHTVVATTGVGLSPFGVDVAPDGARVYVANFSSGTVSVLSTTDQAVVATIPVGVGVWDVEVSPDGAFAYATGFILDRVTVIRTSDLAVVATVPVGDGPRNVVFSPDGFAWVTNQNANTVSVIRVSDHAVVDAVGVLGPFGLAVTPDGGSVWVTTGLGSVSVVTTSGRAVVDVFAAGHGPTDVAFDAARNRAWITNVSTDEIVVLDAADGSIDDALSTGDGPFAVAITPTEPVDACGPEGLLEAVLALGPEGEGSLDRGRARALEATARQALRHLNRGRARPARALLEALIRQIETFANAGALDPDDAAELEGCVGQVLADL